MKFETTGVSKNNESFINFSNQVLSSSSYFHSLILNLTEKDFTELSQAMEIVSHSNIHTVDDFHTINMSVLALPLFVQDKAFGRKKDDQQLRHILNMKQINMRMCTSHGVQDVTSTIKDPSSIFALDAKYTLVPFKYHHSRSKESEHYPLVVSHDSSLSNAATNMCNLDGIHRVVKNEYAQTLTKDEMTSFMNDLEKCNFEFDSKDPKKYLEELADNILEDSAEYKSSIENIDFYKAYQELRNAYQKKSMFRLGICDGAHRITAMFNILYSLAFGSNGLEKVDDPPDPWELSKLKSIARCEIWKYANLGKQNEVMIFVLKI